MWDFYGRRKLERVLLPREAVTAAEVERRWGETLSRRTRVFLVLAHEETEDRDYYFHTLRDVLVKLWGQKGLTRFQVVKPILFNRSWGVRVAVFNRR